MEALRVLSVFSSLVGDDIWWTGIFKLVGVLIEMRQEGVVPGLPRRWRGHGLEWEAQRRLIDASQVAVLRLVQVPRRLCQVQLVQLVSNIGSIVLHAVAAGG